MAAEVMVTARQKGQLEKEGYHLVQLKTQLALEKSSISMRLCRKAQAMFTAGDFW